MQGQVEKRRYEAYLPQHPLILPYLSLITRSTSSNSMHDSSPNPSRLPVILRHHQVTLSKLPIVGLGGRKADKAGPGVESGKDEEHMRLLPDLTSAYYCLDGFMACLLE